MQTPNIEKKNERRLGGCLYFYCFSSGFIEAIKQGGDTCRLIVYGTYIHTFWKKHSRWAFTVSGSGTYFFPLIDKMSGRAEWCLTMFVMESTFMREGTGTKGYIYIYSLLRRLLCSSFQTSLTCLMSDRAVEEIILLSFVCEQLALYSVSSDTTHSFDGTLGSQPEEYLQ